MRKAQLIGLMLWRGGWLLAGVAVAFGAFRAILRVLEIPTGIEVGIALVLSGAVLVLASLIGERVVDYRNESREEP